MFSNLVLLGEDAGNAVTVMHSVSCYGVTRLLTQHVRHDWLKHENMIAGLTLRMMARPSCLVALAIALSAPLKNC